MSSMSGPICLWADWATSVGNEEEKSEVCMCVMCVTAAKLVHRASVAHSVTPANKPATVISTFMVRFFVLTGLCLRFRLVYVFHKHKRERKCKQHFPGRAGENHLTVAHAACRVVLFWEKKEHAICRNAKSFNSKKAGRLEVLNGVWGDSYQSVWQWGQTESSTVYPNCQAKSCYRWISDPQTSNSSFAWFFPPPLFTDIWG